MNQFKHALIIGASSGVGRSLAIELARQGTNVTLAARDIRDLAAIANHISISTHAHATTLQLDLLRPKFVDMGPFDAVFLTAGISLAEDDGSTTNPNVLNLLTTANFTGPAAMLMAAFASFRTRSTPTYIGICSTIAAPVPRTKNMLYAAAKNALESLGRSFQHSVAKLPLKVQIFRLGYVDSALSYGQKLPFIPADPDVVARTIIKNSLKSNARLIYVPFYWRYIVLVLQGVPWFLFSRLRF